MWKTKKAPPGPSVEWPTITQDPNGIHGFFKLVRPEKYAAMNAEIAELRRKNTEYEAEIAALRQSIPRT